MKTILTVQIIVWILFLPMAGKSQTVTFSGNVIDSKSGEALKHVSIFESNDKIGTITDEKGFFKLVLSQGAHDIQISDNGFKEFSQQLILKGDTTLIVKLEPETNSRNKEKNNIGLHADAKTSKKGLSPRLSKK